MTGSYWLPVIYSPMQTLTYIESGTYLFRFMDHRTKYFWSTISDMLGERKLFLNSRKNFNDPYDSQPIIDNDLSNSTIRDYFNNALDSPFNVKRSAIGTARILEMKANGQITLDKRRIENIKIALHKNADKILDDAGLLSFSLTAENPLLWGHYAASFSGICAIFKRGASLSSGLSVCAKVVYVEKRPHLSLGLIHEMTRRRMAAEPHDEIAHQIFFLSFLHKSNHWSYEQEARIFHPFYSFKKLPFDSSELVGFILGPKSPAELEKRLREEIKNHQRTLTMERSTLSKNEFRVIVPHKFSQHHTCAA